MVIKKKINNTSDQLKFITEGGTPPKKEKSWSAVALRVPTEMLEVIATLREDRPGMNRNAWILEALQEKIKRET
jgi:predicted HicB family RNase H-like nuclease